MHSTHLEAEKRRLLDRIAEIRQSGSIAPAYYFIREIITTSPQSKTYRYARLVRQERSVDVQKGRSLGRVGSAEHRAWIRSIARRDAIVELEQQLSLLTQLIERQQAQAHIIDRNFAEPVED